MKTLKKITAVVFLTMMLAATGCELIEEPNFDNTEVGKDKQEDYPGEE